MPVEFSVAAYRFGNSMIRAIYGQAIASAPGLPVIADDKLLIGKATADTVGDAKVPLVSIAGDFAGNAPLWAYVLSDAEVTSLAGPNSDDQTPISLGPVGGTIIAEVFAALLLGDPTSFLTANPDFTPDASFTRNGRFGLTELINAAPGASRSSRPRDNGLPVAGAATRRGASCGPTATSGPRCHHTAEIFGSRVEKAQGPVLARGVWQGHTGGMRSLSDGRRAARRSRPPRWRRRSRPSCAAGRLRPRRLGPWHGHARAPSGPLPPAGTAAPTRPRSIESTFDGRQHLL